MVNLNAETGIKCGYLGPPGTFSQEAGLKSFADKDLIPLKSINQIVDYLKEDKINLGIIPVENSLEGSVNLSMDLLFKESCLQVIGEIIVPIRHFLLASPGIKISDIKRLYSHSQAIGQSNIFINKYLADAKIFFTESTALAAELIAGSNEKAMIGSKRVATIYNLEILAEDIQDYSSNYTRFLIIRNSDNTYIHNNRRIDGEYKTSLVCTPTVNQAGVLHKILGEFSKEGINLTRIESRPTKKQLGEYLFYIDFDGHSSDPEVVRALAEIQKLCGVFKMIGSYLKARVSEGSE